MITLRPADARGNVNLGWLESNHTFSFGSYYDPEHMGFGHLRVINDDVVAPGAGFQTHGHRNMEIITYVLDGAVAHKDSTGGQGVIRQNEVQVMSAGRGIRHSEMNGSEHEPVRLLQIWLHPREFDTTPGYDQRHFPRRPGLTLLVSPDGRDGSLSIRQDADLWRGLLSSGQTETLSLRGPRAWVQVARGAVALNGQILSEGDGAAVADLPTLTLSADGESEFLIFDLA